MRKLKKGRKLSRKTDQRRALIRILASNFILKGKITTTKAKAKELAPFIEKVITVAKKQNLSSRRALISLLSKSAASKAFKDLGPKYKERHGGCTRILRLGPRASDGAEMAIIEFV